MSYLALTMLPATDPLRTKPLLEVGAEYRDKGKKDWRKIDRTFAISRFCFNDLGIAWTEFVEWRAPEKTS